MLYQCLRCGSEFTKSSLKSHLLSRKKPCEPKMDDIDPKIVFDILLGEVPKPTPEELEEEKKKITVSLKDKLKELERQHYEYKERKAREKQMANANGTAKVTQTQSSNTSAVTQPTPNKTNSTINNNFSNNYSLNGNAVTEEQKEQLNKKVDLLVANVLAIIPKHIYDKLNARAPGDNSTIDNNFNVNIVPDNSKGPDRFGYDQPDGTIRTRYIYQMAEREFMIFLTYRSNLPLVDHLLNKKTDELLDNNAPPPVSKDLTKYIASVRENYRQKMVRGDARSKILHQVEDHIEYLKIKDKLGHLEVLNPSSKNIEMEKGERDLLILGCKADNFVPLDKPVSKAKIVIKRKNATIKPVAK